VEVVGTFLLAERGKECADPLPGGIDGAFGGFAHEVLELGEDLLDGIEIGAVGRQEHKARACAPDR